MIHTISIFVWDTIITRHLFSPVFIPFSRAHHFLFSVTLSRAKFSWNTCIRHLATLGIHFSRAKHIFTTIHWAMIHTISIFVWDTIITRHLFSPVFIPFSRAHHFLFSVTLSRAKFSWSTWIRHLATIGIHFSWAKHIFTTIHWAMIHAISIFHWHTSIRRWLLSSFGIPHSRTNHFFFPVAFCWFKLGLCGNSQCKN